MNRHTGSAKVMLLVLAACGQSARTQAPNLGSVADLRERAERIGCVASVTPTYFGAAAFTCTRQLADCGCALGLDVDTTNEGSASRITLVRMSFVGCAPAEGNEVASSILDPLLPESERGRFHQVTAQPGFHTETFARVSIRALFGVRDRTPRRVIWLDPHPSASSEHRVPDSAPQAPPCRRTPRARPADRNVITFAVTEAHVNWRAAIQAVHAARSSEQEPLPTMTEEERGRRMLAPLVATVPVQGDPVSRASVKPGITALQIAGEAAADWRDRVVYGLAAISDRELDALLESLPAEHELSQASFEQRLR